MPEIRILSDQVANQIAAGEVVERPVAVLKELVENSLDAGASKIEIEFRNGGKSYLCVEDDGKAMSPDQALLSLERHATSKIRKASDLNRVGTFGFRGEALPSISSVSRFILRTRPLSFSEGTEIFINGGKMIHCKECGMPPGTRIEVSHLFNSVPGRRKFLKTEVTEAAHLIHMAKLYALAHPSVTFSLLENGRSLFRSPGCESPAERVREIFGRVLAESLEPIDKSEQGFSLSGLIARPGQSRSTRKEMIFFVNQRPVESKTISYAVMEAFHSFVPKGRFPPAILFLDIDPEAVDVNVHPSKREIRFREEAKVRRFIVQSVLSKNKEMAGHLMPEEEGQGATKNEDEKGEEIPQIDARALELFGLKNPPSLHSKSETSLDKKSSGHNHIDLRQEDGQTIKNFQDNEIINQTLVGKRRDLAAQWRLLDRMHGDLVFFSTRQGVVALHARAAYERVRLEQMEDNLRNRNSCVSQSLLLPEALEFDGVDRANLEASADKLRELGFILEEFGRNFYRLEGCPAWIEPELASNFLNDFLALARESSGELKLESFAREALERQANYRLETSDDFSDEEIIDLTARLLKCRNPYVCPRGRPVYFEIPLRDFESRFKRKL